MGTETPLPVLAKKAASQFITIHKYEGRVCTRVDGKDNLRVMKVDEHIALLVAAYNFSSIRPCWVCSCLEEFVAKYPTNILVVFAGEANRTGDISSKNYKQKHKQFYKCLAYIDQVVPHPTLSNWYEEPRHVYCEKNWQRIVAGEPLLVTRNEFRGLSI